MKAARPKSGRVTYPAKKCHIFAKIQKTKATSTAARSAPCHYFSITMQPNEPQMNNQYKTSLDTDKWIQFCEWNQNEFEFGQGMMHLCQCARITTTGQSPWVNAIHPLQGSFMSWRINVRKAWGKRVNRFNTWECVNFIILKHHERMMFWWTS